MTPTKRTGSLPPAFTALTAQALAGHDFCTRLRATYLTVHRRANVIFARFKLTADQFVLLTILAESNGIAQKELARRANSDANTISAMVARLEGRGLLERERHADDGRALRVSLTKVGREAQRRAMEGAAPFNESLANLVAAEELERLVTHLDRIASRVSESGFDPDGDAASLPTPPVRTAGVV